VFLCLTKAELLPGKIPGQFVFVETPLTLYGIAGSMPPIIPAALSEQFGPSAVVPLHVVDDPLSARLKPCTASPAGSVVSGFVGEDPPTVPIDEAFNIVVLGDGFSEGEREDFVNWARKLVDGVPSHQIPGLKDRKPFVDVWSAVNVRFVETISTDSGISGCSGQRKCPGSAVSPRQTYYGLSGCFEGLPGPGYVGTTSVDLIYQAAEQAFCAEYTHLYIMLANCRVSGGSGHPDQQLVYLTLWENDGSEEFVRAGAHECGHAIAWLADEYIACSPKDVTRVHPNQATADEVESGTVPWTPLAVSQETTRAGDGRVHLVAVEKYGGKAVAAARYDWLGAFWGCQDFDTEEVEDLSCNPWTDKRGSEFFRPMHECRMRKLRWEFCRVCSKAITDHITAISAT
jgi:hypothetical protein